MKKETKGLKLKLFLIFFIFTVISMFVALFLIGSTFSNAFFYWLRFCVITVIPVVIIAFIIFILVQRTKYAKFVNMKSIIIASIVFSAVIIGHFIQFNYEWSPPNEIIDFWKSEYGRMDITFDDTYAWKHIHLEVNDNVNGWSNDGQWDYDKSTHNFVIYFPFYPTDSSNRAEDFDYEWQILLKIELEDSGAMITQYISDNDVPFNASKVFDDVTWNTYYPWV